MATFASQEPKICQRFSAADAELTFQSSDRVLFKIHRNNLSVTAGAFPASDIPDPKPGETTLLSEDSATLELLFQYSYPQRQPNLDDVEFPVLAKLAEASEKYEVYAAIYSCKFHMKKAHKTQPLEVLDYAVKHNYMELADVAAPFTIEKPLDVVASSLSPLSLQLWLKYLSKWTFASRSCIQSHIRKSPGRCGSNRCDPHLQAFMVHLIGGPSAIADRDTLQKSVDQLCEACKQNVNASCDEFSTIIAREVPLFREVLKA